MEILKKIIKNIDINIFIICFTLVIIISIIESNLTNSIPKTYSLENSVITASFGSIRFLAVAAIMGFAVSYILSIRANIKKLPNKKEKIIFIIGISLVFCAGCFGSLKSDLKMQKEIKNYSQMIKDKK